MCLLRCRVSTAHNVIPQNHNISNVFMSVSRPTTCQCLVWWVILVRRPVITRDLCPPDNEIWIGSWMGRSGSDIACLDSRNVQVCGPPATINCLTQLFDSCRQSFMFLPCWTEEGCVLFVYLRYSSRYSRVWPRYLIVWDQWWRHRSTKKSCGAFTGYRAHRETQVKQVWAHPVSQISEEDRVSEVWMSLRGVPVVCYECIDWHECGLRASRLHFRVLLYRLYVETYFLLQSSVSRLRGEWSWAARRASLSYARLKMLVLLAGIFTESSKLTVRTRQRFSSKRYVRIRNAPWQYH